MIRTISAELLAFSVAFFFTVFAGGIVVGTGANVFWPVLLVMGGIGYYVLRPWARQILHVPTRGRS
jgi:hypothetical protein